MYFRLRLELLSRSYARLPGAGGRRSIRMPAPLQSSHPLTGYWGLLIEINPNHRCIGSKTTIVSIQHSSTTQSCQVDASEPSQPSSSGSGRSKARSIIELMRWHKPTGTLLALLPSLWSVALATPATALTPDLKTMAIFTAGALVARGMGCTVNDVLDRKYDRLVKRTKMRPIACGDISTKEALAYLSVQSGVGLYVLCLNNLEVIKLGLFSGLMIASYPLFKRFTYWPQAMLALTMNWGVLMGFAAIKGVQWTGELTAVMPIYLGSIFWTLYYDTIYAHQDKTDDKFIGVKSSALRLGSQTKPFLDKMIGGMFISLSLAGYATGQIWPYYLSLASVALIQARQVRGLNLDDTDQCWKAFDHQKYIGSLILGGALVSVALKSKVSEKEPQTSEIKS